MTLINERIVKQLQHLGYSAKYIAIPSAEVNKKLRKWDYLARNEALVRTAKAAGRGQCAEIAKQYDVPVSVVYKLRSHGLQKKTATTLLYMDVVKEIYDAYPNLRGTLVYIPKPTNERDIRGRQVDSKKRIIAELLKKGRSVDYIVKQTATTQSYVYQVRRELARKKKK